MVDAEAPRVGWGVLGTAGIASRAFLPALRETKGHAVVVGSREPEHAGEWAAANAVGRADSYSEVLADSDVDAVYVALPNDQHVSWAAAAVAAGKVVLCEKPMALNAGQARGLLASVGRDALLWESFVFPFHPQTARIIELIEQGRIGRLAEVVSEFHFTVGHPGNIRLQAERGGGALYDVGCYPVRLARLISGREPLAAIGSAHFSGGSVDVDVAAILEFPDELRLILSAGLRRVPSTYTRIIGSDGELRVSNPFHPTPADTVELWVDNEQVQRWPADDGTAFRYAIEHIHRVMAGDAPPLHLAVDDAVAQAEALDLVRAAVPTSHSFPTYLTDEVPSA